MVRTARRCAPISIPVAIGIEHPQHAEHWSRAVSLRFVGRVNFSYHPQPIKEEHHAA
jgi:hypothetical protein